MSCPRSRPPVPYPPRPLRLSALAAAAALLAPADAAAQNSTRKLRQAPSALAGRAGTAVPWLASLDEALVQARATGKPVFWYVPTLAGSPMDRTAEIDRYLMAGPFAWPSTVALLREHFVPVRMPAGRAQAARYDLRPHRFVEPGWLVLAPDGTERQRLQQLSTFQPEWFEAPLRRLCGLGPPVFACPDGLRPAWDAYRRGDLRGCLAALAAPPSGEEPAPGDGALFLQGVALRRSNDRPAAHAAWSALLERFPDSPLAPKVAMELEGHGPFARGFEDYLPVPDVALRELAEGSRAPPGTFDEARLWTLSVRFLLRLADDDGVLRDSTYDFGGTDSLPNVHLAISFLAGEALLCAAARHDDGRIELDGDDRRLIEERLAALRRAAQDGPFARQDRDELLWAFAYRIRFLARWAALRPADGPGRTALLPLLETAVAELLALQPEDGVWFHEYGNPFATATALQALALAQGCGVAVDQGAVERGLRALLRCRARTGAYTYGDPGRGPAEAAVTAAAGRMPLCELALLSWSGSDQDALEAALSAAFAHHGLLAAVRKYDDHADRHGYGGFFFWFDMLGRAEATMAVADAARQEAWKAQQRALVLELPEYDGCFVDSHELGRGYGTAMALLCLAALGG